jgi:hypothetical protein
MPLACGQLIAALTAFTLGEVRAGRFGWGTHWAVVAGLLLLGAVLAGTGRAIGHGSGVTLRPDGIVADKTNGSLSVPWEALEAWRPVPRGEPGKLRVGYLRPGLVRTTGVVRARDELIFDGADRQFVAAAIHTYVTEPGRRHAIGTAAEHERLLAERVPVPERIEKPRTAREIAGLLAGGSVLFLGGITLDTWLDGRHHWVSVAIHMPSAIGAILLVTGGKAVRAARRERRAPRTGLRS